MKVSGFILSSFVALSFSLTLAGCAHNGTRATSSETLYEKGQKEYHRKNYPKAFKYLKAFIDKEAGNSKFENRITGAVNEIGTVYLRVQHDPEKAISFFERLLKLKGLTEAQQDDFQEWLAASKEWKSLSKPPRAVKDPDQLFSYGLHYYKLGLQKSKKISQSAAVAEMQIAASYLIPFIIHHDDDPRVGQALLMMGDVRRRSWTDMGYWSENFYLKEVIRRFPHTALAQHAYKILEEDVHFGYTGSSGDHTPASLLRMLDVYRKLSLPEGAPRS